MTIRPSPIDAARPGTQPVRLSLSRRGATAPASPIRRLAPFASIARERGVHVHHLNIGQPDLPTPEAMRAAYRGYDERVLAYSPSEGTASVRGAFADYYGRLGVEPGGGRISPDQILVTVGGSEALLFVIAAACDPGDQILVAEPYYTNYMGFAHMLGVEVVALPTFGSEGFAVSPERASEVLDAVGSRVRALIVPSPGNPTGAVLSAGTLASLGALCVARGIFLVVDEVYREFVYTEGLSVAPSVLAVPGLEAHAVVVDSLSKRYSACGARVGCLVTRNEGLYQACLKFAQARLSPPTVDQIAAEAALRLPPEAIAPSIAEYRRRRDALVAGLRAIDGVRCPLPEGAFYVVVDLPVADAEAFCVFLLESFDLDGETVMLAPAEGFYRTPGAGRSQVRVAYVLDCPRLERCVAIIAAGLAVFNEGEGG